VEALNSVDFFLFFQIEAPLFIPAHRKEAIWMWDMWVNFHH